MLDDYMVAFGYSSEQIKLIKSSYFLKNRSDSDILYNFKSINSYFSRNGLSNEDIINITITIPNIICTSLENIKVRVFELSNYSLNKIDIFELINKYPYIIDMSINKIDNKYKFFYSFGFTNKAINNIFINYPELLNVDISLIDKRLKFFKEYGYSDLSYLFEMCPSLLDISLKNIEKRLNDISNLGFTKNEVIKITTYSPNLFIVDNDSINNIIVYLLDYGYSKKNIVGIIKKIPIILKDYYWNELPKKIDNLNKLSFTNKDIVEIIISNPYILLYSIEYINNCFDNFKKFGFDSIKIKQIIIDTPLLLGYNYISIKEKLSFYKSKGILGIIFNNPEYLLFNFDLVKERFNIINSESYDDLFMNDSDFYKKYNVRIIKD